MSAPDPVVAPSADEPEKANPQGGLWQGGVVAGNAIARTLSIEPGEGARTVALSALLFVASMIFVMGRTARDALFLTRFPVTWIAYMWIGYGIVSSLVAVLYGAASSRWDRQRFVVGFTAAAAASYVLVRVLIGADMGWAIAFFYIWAEVMANLVIVVAWTITNDLHDPRSAKRLFGVIGAGRIVGMLLSGFVTGAIVRAIGTANLIIVIVGWMVVFIVLVRWIGARYPLAKAAKCSSARTNAADAPTSRPHRIYARWLSVMLVVIFVALTVGDYQFKAIAKLAHPQIDDLAAYMAGFYAAVGAIAFVFQVFFTPRILRNFGVLAGLMAMPAAFLSSTAVLAVFPVLGVATALKLSDNGLQYTIHDSTMQVLYFAFPPSLRGRLRALLDAIMKPLGYSIGGIALVFLSPVPRLGESSAQLAERIGHVGILSLGLGLAWIGLGPIVRRAYVEALRVSLVRRQSDVNEETDVPYDAGVRRILLDAIRSGDPAQVSYAAERLASSEPEALRAELPSLRKHVHGEVRALALRHAAQLKDPNAIVWAREAVDEPDAGVRAAAIQALGEASPEEAFEELALYVADDARPPLRNAAISALLCNAGLDGVVVAGARLRELMKSPTSDDRIAAATILGSVGRSSLARSLKALISDSDPAVRRAALAASTRCATPALIDTLLQAMSDRRTAKASARALIAIGEDAVASLYDVLASHHTHRTIRLQLPRVLQQIGTPRALSGLLNLIDDDDEGVRQKVLAGASRLREALHAPALPAGKLRPLIRAEAKDHAVLREAYWTARPWIARPLLDAQVRLELRGHIVRVLRFCELAYEREHVAAARAAILSGDSVRTANALEVLDNVLDREDRESILDSLARFSAATAFRECPELKTGEAPESVVAWAQQRAELPGVYRRGLLFEAVAIRGIRRLSGMAFSYLGSDHPFMRENALMALAACQPPGWQERMATHAENDECPIVRGYARFVLEQGHAGLDPEDEMYTTVEKILFLQGIPLFSGVPGNDLMPLARASTIVRLAKKAEVFRLGDPGDSLYVVVHGKVAISNNGNPISELGPGEAFGEMAILDQEPRMTDAIVSEDADLLKVSAEDFLTALEETAEVAAGVIRVLSRRLRQASAPTPGGAADARPATSVSTVDKTS